MSITINLISKSGSISYHTSDSLIKHSLTTGTYSFDNIIKPFNLISGIFEIISSTVKLNIDTKATLNISNALSYNIINNLGIITINITSLPSYFSILNEQINITIINNNGSLNLSLPISIQFQDALNVYVTNNYGTINANGSATMIVYADYGKIIREPTINALITPGITSMNNITIINSTNTADSNSSTINVNNINYNDIGLSLPLTISLTYNSYSKNIYVRLYNNLTNGNQGFLTIPYLDLPSNLYILNSSNNSINLIYGQTSNPIQSAYSNQTSITLPKNDYTYFNGTTFLTPQQNCIIV